MEASAVSSQKHHHVRQAGAKAKKKVAKKVAMEPKGSRKNHKAFGVNKVQRAKRSIQRNLDRSQKREHVSITERAPPSEPPVIIVVMGPPKTGKTTLIKSLVKKFTKHSLSDVRGPITVVVNKTRRITFIECPPDINAMVDLGKVADLVLLTIDASFGFEMETFEFLNVLQTHGFPRVMGVLTFLDGPRFRTAKQVRARKKELKQRFWVEVYQGAKLFYLSGLIGGQYQQREVHNLGLFLTRIKFRPIAWRAAHPYVLSDRVEDLTPPAELHRDPKCDRTVALFGFVRGASLARSALLHFCGVGDFRIKAVRTLDDPVPLPETDPEKRKARRTLNAKETLLYAPMSDAGAVVFDKDAVYINVPHVHFSAPETLLASADAAASGRRNAGGMPDMRAAIEETGASSSSSSSSSSSLAAAAGAAAGALETGGRSNEGVSMVKDLQQLGHGLDAGIAGASMSLLRGSAAVLAKDVDLRAAARGNSWLRGPEEDDSSSDDDSDQEEEDDALEAREQRKLPTEESVESDGRIRRRAHFAQDQEDEDDDDDAEGVNWKHGMARRAREALAERRSGRVDLEALVYGGDGAVGDLAADEAGGDSSDDDDDDGFFKPKQTSTSATGSSSSSSTSVSASAPSASAAAEEDNLDAEDVGVWATGVTSGAAVSWEDDQEALASLKNRFVTGDWGAKARSAARELLGLSSGEAIATAGSVSGDSDSENTGSDSDEDGDAAFGDFEDLETGETFGPGSGVTPAAAAAASSDDDDDADSDSDSDSSSDGADAEGGSDDEERERLRSAQAALHSQFSRSYDAKEKRPSTSSAGKDSDAESEADDDDRAAAAAMDDDSEFARHGLDDVDFGPQSEKARAARRAAQDAINEEEMGGVSSQARAAMMGHQQGEYVRIELENVPPELFHHFTASRPLILGAVPTHEQGMSLVRLRLKRHRWSPRQLKNEDPLVFSIGWRRFQSIPLYSIRDDMQERNRFLKYTPEHMHCEATIWAPTTPTNVGFLAYQTVSARAAAFRIAATGTVLELDDKFRVMKKLKLVGTPTKVFRNTALIRGMFNSDLEVAKFSDAKIRTVSGIRGRVRKAIKDGAPGTFRAVFEDKVLHSDIVILKTWAPVETKRFCHNVTSLLVPASFEDAFDRRQKLLGLVEGDDDYKGGRDEEMAEAEAKDALDDDDDKDEAKTRSSAPAASSASARASARVGDVADDTGGLLLMRPMRQLRRDHGVLVQDKQSSWYQPQERHEKRFFPLRIPDRLQAKLPFASKPKQLEARNRLAYSQKRAVVLEDHERRTLSTLQRVHTVRKAREKKTKEGDVRRKQAKEAVAAREAAKWAPAAKAQKKEEYREMGKQNSKRVKRQQEQRGDG